MRYTKEELLKGIEDYKAWTTAKPAQLDAAFAKAMSDIESLSAEIRDMLDVANAAKSAGIDILDFQSDNPGSFGFIDDAPCDNDATIARIGLAPICNAPEFGKGQYAGVRKDGAFEVCCRYTNGDTCWPFVFEFLDNWEKFRNRFCEYVKSTCDKRSDWLASKATTVPKEPAQEKPDQGQVWLAKLAYKEDSPSYKAVIKITSYRNDSELFFRNLESDAPFENVKASEMPVFELLRLVKD